MSDAVRKGLSSSRRFNMDDVQVCAVAPYPLLLLIMKTSLFNLSRPQGLCCFVLPGIWWRSA